MARRQAEKRAEAAAWSARTLAEAAAADRAIEELRPQLRMQLARLAVRAFTPMRCIGKQYGPHVCGPRLCDRGTVHPHQLAWLAVRTALPAEWL